jgi:hypothetical protein
MRAGETATTDAGAWFVEADHVSVTSQARRRSRARLNDEQAKAGRVAVVTSLFFVLLATTLLIGGHAAIDPLLQSAVAARESQGIGDVVYTMPDGVFCRHVSFDNATAQVSEGALERCQKDAFLDLRPRPLRSFAWRSN